VVIVAIARMYVEFNWNAVTNLFEVRHARWKRYEGRVKIPYNDNLQQRALTQIMMAKPSKRALFLSTNTWSLSWFYTTFANASLWFVF